MWEYLDDQKQTDNKKKREEIKVFIIIWSEAEKKIWPCLSDIGGWLLEGNP